MSDRTRRLHSSLRICVIEFLEFEELKCLGLSSKEWYCMCIREIYKRGFSSPNRPMYRFLNCHDRRKQVLLVSYPRGGNTLVRRLTEQLTGIWTGSDTIPTRTLVKQLLNMGMDGEGVSDSSVWLVKSHFPERHGEKRKSFHRVILVVRNPFDCLNSYFNMIFTNTHNKSLTQDSFDKLMHVWSKFVENEALIWNAFYKYWIKGFCNDVNSETDQREGPIDLAIVRYEDLVIEESFHRVLTDLHCFLYSDASISKHESDEAFSRIPFINLNNPVYQKRNGRGSSLDHFSERDVSAVLQASSEAMNYFGYGISVNENNDRIMTLGQPQYPLLGTSCTSCASPCLVRQVTINKRGINIRAPNDIYGTNSTFLRKGLTKDDEEPFDCI